jgi:hypothetical protein
MKFNKLFVLLPAATLALLPQWKATYNMSESTAFMPCNASDWFNATFAAQWGLVDFDWSNAKDLWANTKPMDCQERLLAQVMSVKLMNPSTKTFVYRNLVKALPWYTEVREKLDDPAYAGWFLKFKDYGTVNTTSYYVPPCTGNKCSQFYHDQEQTPGHPHGDGNCRDECDCGTMPCGEYLWDHRNQSLRDWLIDSFVFGSTTGVGNVNVDGVFLDDGWTDQPSPRKDWWPPQGYCSADAIGGASEVYPNCTLDMGLTQADTTALKENYTATLTRLFRKLHDAKKFAWQMFYETTAAPSPEDCIEKFQTQCVDNSPIHASAWMATFSDRIKRPLTQPLKDLAAFLLLRGDYAWLGYAWIGCSNDEEFYERPRELDVDYGAPVDDHCFEVLPGIFRRQWTKATITFDCNAYEADITMELYGTAMESVSK